MIFDNIPTKLLFLFQHTDYLLHYMKYKVEYIEFQKLVMRHFLSIIMEKSSQPMYFKIKADIIGSYRTDCIIIELFVLSELTISLKLLFSVYDR